MPSIDTDLPAIYLQRLLGHKADSIWSQSDAVREAEFLLHERARPNRQGRPNEGSVARKRER